MLLTSRNVQRTYSVYFYYLYYFYKNQYFYWFLLRTALWSWIWSILVFHVHLKRTYVPQVLNAVLYICHKVKHINHLFTYSILLLFFCPLDLLSVWKTHYLAPFWVFWCGLCFAQSQSYKLVSRVPGYFCVHVKHFMKKL